MEQKVKMNKPILSICIPTYNRSNYLEKTLFFITSEKIFENTNDIEIVISDNSSTDNTSEICSYYVNKFPGKIKYIHQQVQLDWGNQFSSVLNYGSGRFLKLNNDTCYFKCGMLEKVVNFLKTSQDTELLFIFNKEVDNYNIDCYKSFGDLLDYISYDITWIGSFCIRKDIFNKFKDKLDHFDSLIPQVDLYGKLFLNNYKVTVWKEKLLITQKVEKKGGKYNVSEVFGKNYFGILNSYIDKNNGITPTTIKKEKKKIINFINDYYFDHNENYTFNQTGYLKYMFPIYKKEPYFYFLYLQNMYKKFSKFIFKITKTETDKEIRLFNFIKLKIKNKIPPKTPCELKNTHNKTKLVNPAPLDKIFIGNATYGPIDAVFSSGRDEKLIIGNYCSIANGVKFIVASEHPYEGLSTYPFKVFYLGYRFEAKSKGSIIIKDDVWIATNAIILSGVTIGQGAIIGAGAVVTKDVPPYAIVAGNPARIIKYRFSPTIIEKLLKFDFSTLTEEKIKQLNMKLYDKITEENVDELLEELGVNV